MQVYLCDDIEDNVDPEHDSALFVVAYDALEFKAITVCGKPSFAVYEPVTKAFLGYSSDGISITHDRSGSIKCVDRTPTPKN